LVSYLDIHAYLELCWLTQGSVEIWLGPEFGGLCGTDLADLGKGLLRRTSGGGVTGS